MSENIYPEFFGDNNVLFSREPYNTTKELEFRINKTVGKNLFICLMVFGQSGDYQVNLSMDYLFNDYVLANESIIVGNLGVGTSEKNLTILCPIYANCFTLIVTLHTLTEGTFSVYTAEY